MSSKVLCCDVAVIGGGPAGMAAALSAQKNGASALIIERNAHLGGILRQCIHPGFGLTHFKEELTGPEYAQRYINMVEDARIKTLTNTMVLSINSPWRHVAPVSNSDPEPMMIECMSADGMILVEAGAAVLAMGCRERTRSEIKIPGTRPAGVFTAGLAQQYINIKNLKPGSRAVILGSGDIGLIMARRCALEGIEVEGVYELMPYANGLDRNIKNCLDDFGIPLHLSTTVTRIIGRSRVEAVEVSQVDDKLAPIPGTERRIPCDTLLLSVGLIPENELSTAAGVELNPRTRGALVDDTLMTTVPGIFSCGNVLHVHDLADNVSDEATQAGKHAAAWALAHRKEVLSKKKCAAEASTAAETDRAVPANSPEESTDAGALVPLHIGVSPAGAASYVLPTTINHATSTKLFFRARTPLACARVRITAGNTVLFEGKPRSYKPSIMEAAFLTQKMIESVDPGTQLTFSLESVEDEVA